MLERYKKVVRFGGMKVPPEILLLVGMILAGASLFSFLLGSPILGIALLVLADLVAGFPYVIGEKRLRQFEENLPDALRQIGAILRSGGTFEMALREVAASGLGVASEEFGRVLTDMQAGISFQGALERLSIRVPSETLKRVVTIIKDAVRAGGGLSEVLEDVAEDARELVKIKKERETKTGMQTMFITMASVVLGPFIFGSAVGLMHFMQEMGRSLQSVNIISEAELARSMATMGALSNLLLTYTLIQTTVSAIMVSIIRGEGIGGALKRVPVHIAIAYLIFLAGQWVVSYIT